MIIESLFCYTWTIFDLKLNKIQYIGFNVLPLTVFYVFANEENAKLEIECLTEVHILFLGCRFVYFPPRDGYSRDKKVPIALPNCHTQISEEILMSLRVEK